MSHQVITIGSERTIFAGTCNEVQRGVNALLKTLKPNGDGAVFGDGTRVFICDSEHISEHGRLTWDDSGKRCLHRRERITHKPDGTSEVVLLKTVFKAFA